MNMFFIEPLWGQPANGGELIPFLILVLFVVIQVVRVVLKYQNILANPKSQGAARPAPEENEFPDTKPNPVRQRNRSQRSEARMKETISEAERSRRKTLNRELAPQGSGARFEATPGTFDAANLVAPSIEPTVKPTLESLTGIYETPPGAESAETMSMDLRQLIAKPAGIRQAVILAEILKRPEY